MAFRDDIKRTIATVLYPGYVKNPETDLCMARRSTMDKKAAAEIKKLYKEATGVINNSDNKNYDRASDEVKQAIAALKALA